MPGILEKLERLFPALAKERPRQKYDLSLEGFR
jgi:hypothetical protein